MPEGALETRFGEKSRLHQIPRATHIDLCPQRAEGFLVLSYVEQLSPYRGGASPIRKIGEH